MTFLLFCIMMIPVLLFFLFFFYVALICHTMVDETKQNNTDSPT
jgi:hypothetical protein